MKVASVETMKTFDDHRRKVAAEKAVVATAEMQAAVSDPIERLLAAEEDMAANDDADERAELVAYSTLSRSQLDLFSELHRSIRLEDDEDARFNGFKAVRPGPGSDMLLFAADDERLSEKKAHATDYALAESKARAFLTGALMRSKLARGSTVRSRVTPRTASPPPGSHSTRSRGRGAPCFVSFRSPKCRRWRTFRRVTKARNPNIGVQTRSRPKSPPAWFPSPQSRIRPSPLPSPHPTPVAPVSAAPKLSEVRDLWIAEGKAKEWSPKTGDARVVMVDLFIALAEDRPIDSYTKADARTFKDALTALPPNWSKTKSLRVLTVAAAAKKAKADGMTPMSVTNVNKHLNCLYSLMAWAAIRRSRGAVSVRRSFAASSRGWVDASPKRRPSPAGPGGRTGADLEGGERRRRSAVPHPGRCDPDPSGRSRRRSREIPTCRDLARGGPAGPCSHDLRDFEGHAFGIR